APNPCGACRQPPRTATERRAAWVDLAELRLRGVERGPHRRAVADATGLRFDLPRLDLPRFDLPRHEPRVVALPVTHPLAGRPAVAIGEQDGEPHVTDDEADLVRVRWWACDPRPSGVPVRDGPSVRTMDELLVVASGQAVVITGGFVADNRREVVFVPVTGVQPGPLSLCTRTLDTSPPVAALRHAVRRIGDRPG
ncbi:MAG: LysR substrate-binding domain-containing protein, partial [Pseudonocardia sp.]